MSLLCGKNPALDAVNAVKDQIKAKLADKKGALGSLASQAAALKSKLGELKASIPTLDSFQTELAALVGASPAQIAAFKEKWKGKVAELDSLVAKATSGISDALDFCKDVPNVKLDPATGSTITEAKESSTPNTNPESAESVESTVVDNTENTSVGNSEVIPKTVVEQFKESVEIAYQEQVRGPLYKEARAKWEVQNSITSSSQYKAILVKYAKNWTSLDEMILKVDSQEDVALLQSLRQAQQERRIADNLKASTDKYYIFALALNAGDTDPEAALTWEKIKDTNSLEYRSIYGDADLTSWLDKIDAIISGNSQIAADYYKYRQNIS